MCLRFQSVWELTASKLTSAPIPKGEQPDQYFYAYKAVLAIPETPILQPPCYPGLIHPGWNFPEGALEITHGGIHGGALHLCVSPEAAAFWSLLCLKVVVRASDILAFDNGDHIELAVKSYYLSQEEYDAALIQVVQNMEHGTDLARAAQDFLTGTARP